jgi:hypothetical protein
MSNEHKIIPGWNDFQPISGYLKISDELLEVFISKCGMSCRPNDVFDEVEVAGPNLWVRQLLRHSASKNFNVLCYFQLKAEKKELIILATKHSEVNDPIFWLSAYVCRRKQLSPLIPQKSLFL